MELIIAETAGFCMGVDLALRKLDDAIMRHPAETIHTLGPIIHNPQVLEHYATQGVRKVDADALLPQGDVLIIRAHGVPLPLQERFEKQGLQLIDATCPKVKKAQILIRKQAELGKHLLLFGEQNHPEVRGLVSYAPMHSVFESLEELQNLTLDPAGTYFLAAQTTQDRDQFGLIATYLRNQIDPQAVILDTICTATKDRQEEVRTIAKKVQAMVIVGGKDSGNTRRLAQIAQETGVYAVHVETAAELPLDTLRKFSSIGLTAGASTPGWIIREVAAALHHALS